jgi:hypothetical protein
MMLYYDFYERNLEKDELTSPGTWLWGLYVTYFNSLKALSSFM